MQQYFRSAHPFTKLVFSLLIMLAAFFAIMIIGFIIAIPAFSLSLNDLVALLENPNSSGSINFLKYLQSLQSFGLFIAPAFLIAFLIFGKPLEELKLKKGFSAPILVILFFIIAACFPVINFAAVINSKLQLPEWMSGIETWMKNAEESARVLTESLVKADNIPSLLFNLFMIAVLPGIGEELIFRGILQRIFIDWTKSIHWGIFISAFLFSAMHLQFYGFIPRLILGMIFGYLFVWSGTLWIPIIAHFLNNAIAVLAYYYTNDGLTEEIESFGTTSETWLYFAIGFIFLGLLLRTFYKQTRVLSS